MIVQQLVNGMGITEELVEMSAIIATTVMTVLAKHVIVVVMLMDI